MTVRTHFFANGAYRVIKNVNVNAFGGWISCQKKWEFKEGAWRLVFQRGFNLTDTIVNGYDYNVYNVAMGTGQWDGAMPVFANITVAGTLGSSTANTYDWQGYINMYPDLQQGLAQTGNYYGFGPVAFAKYHYYTLGINEGRTLPLATVAPFAFDSGPLPAGSVINLNITPGSILSGAGGNGGYGGTYRVNNSYPYYVPSTGGTPGGTAIRTTVPTTIVNNGVIGGGGGGGGGGSGVKNQGKDGQEDAGAAGGGGAGNVAGQQGGSSVQTATYIGQNGSALTGGAGGTTSNTGSKEWVYARNGGRGGDLGQAGQWSPPGQGEGNTVNGFPGGAPGLAVTGVSNVVWQVLGDVRGATA